MPAFIRPEFFDIFGIAAFAFLGMTALRGIRTRTLPEWAFWAILVIAVLGLAVDGTIVLITYLL